MLAKKHGKQSMSNHGKLNEAVREKTLAYDESMIKGENSAIYNFGVGVIEGEQLTISRDSIAIPGQPNEVSLLVPNPYDDMA